MKKNNIILIISSGIFIACLILIVVSFLFPVKGEQSISLNQNIGSKYDSAHIKKEDILTLDFEVMDTYSSVKGVDLIFNAYGVKLHSGYISYKIENKNTNDVIYEDIVDCRRILDSKTVRFTFDIPDDMIMNELRMICSFQNIPDDIELSVLCVNNVEKESKWSKFNGHYIDGNFYCNLICESDTNPYIMDLLLILCCTFIVLVLVKNQGEKK